MTGRQLYVNRNRRIQRGKKGKEGTKIARTETSQCMGGETEAQEGDKSKEAPRT